MQVTKMQLTSVVLLCLICSGFSSDVDEAKDAMEEEMLSSLYTSEVKQSRHSAPLWQLPLQNMCRMLGSISESWQDWTAEEIQTAYEQRLSTALSQTLQDLYNLQSLCRILHPRELHYGEEYLELDQDSENPLKRKSPYILKRQLHTNKARRPYILKRSSFY
ncbi:neurotensin/neuromedin N [Astyanax mexicanus]|uniref:neurotensin/neuromedin N n=1 Tax=Astyanax mexicanus TaxID=7994 RepID=UPI000BBD4AF1|nr:neurotensin/neuromedin N [Astyanax mexicanus]